MLFFSAPALAGELDQPLNDLLRGSLTQDTAPVTIQPALGRAVTQLADLYIARRIDRAAVERLMGNYQDMLHSAGPDTIIAVSLPVPSLKAITETPDGSLARTLYERAASYGYAAAWVGLGLLYQGGHLPGDETNPQKAFAAFSTAASLGSVEGRLRVAELSISGLGTKRDIAGGVAALKDIATTDDLRILQELATLCLSGRIPVQTDLAMTALRRAGDLGAVDADIRLGNLYSRGEEVSNNDTLALRHYERAVTRGSKAAEVRIAEMRARGHGLPKNVEKARSALEALAKAGEPRALVALGDIYATGEVLRAEPLRALSYYMAAATHGAEAGFALLGKGYQEGMFGARDNLKALKMYGHALEKGRRGAIVEIGRLEAGSRKKLVSARGIAALRQAFEVGTDGAAVALAESMFYGSGVAQDPKSALNVLLKAAHDGNRQALLSLISTYRDGKVDGRAVLVRKDARKTEALLASASSTLPEPEKRIQRFLLESSAAKVSAFASLTDRFKALSRHERKAVLRELAKVNPKLFVWLVKSHLKEAGLYAGETNSKADRSFTATVRRYCGSRLTRRQCDQGPFSRTVGELLSYAF